MLRKVVADSPRDDGNFPLDQGLPAQFKRLRSDQPASTDVRDVCFSGPLIWFREIEMGAFKKRTTDTYHPRVRTQCIEFCSAQTDSAFAISDVSVDP